MSSGTSECSNLDPKTDEAKRVLNGRFDPILELTHNHGTEDQEGPAYHTGNTDPKGFGHLAFLCDNIEKACEDLKQNNISFKKLPQEGKIKGIAFALDPDGYWVELIQRNWDAKFD